MPMKGNDIGLHVPEFVKQIRIDEVLEMGK